MLLIVNNLLQYYNTVKISEQSKKSKQNIIFLLLLLLKGVYSKKGELMMHFMNAMHSIANVTGRDVATAFNLSRFRTACDVGGRCVAYLFYLLLEYKDF